MHLNHKLRESKEAVSLACVRVNKLLTVVDVSVKDVRRCLFTLLTKLQVFSECKYDSIIVSCFL